MTVPCHGDARAGDGGDDPQLRTGVDTRGLSPETRHPGGNTNYDADRIGRFR